MVGGQKMPVLGYEMTSQELCPMYTAPEYMVPAHVWEKHPDNSYYGGMPMRSPNNNNVTYNAEGLLTRDSDKHALFALPMFDC